MPYTNAQATPRADIFALVQQANADFNKLFIGDLILPPKIEDARRGVYMKANLANAELLNADALPREGGAGYNRVNRRFDTDTYDCQEYGLESIVDDSYEAEVERFMNLEATEAMLLERSLKISYELRVASAIFNTTTFGAGASPTANYTAANLATIDVPNDIDIAKTLLLKKGIIPNAIVMNQDVFNRIRRTTFLQNQVFGVVPRDSKQRMLPSEQDIANVLGVENLFVAKAPYNTANKAAAYSGSFVFPPTFIFVGQVAGGEYTAGGVGRTISWGKDSVGLFTPETYRSDERRSNVIRVRQTVAEKIIDSSAGTLITTNFS